MIALHALLDVVGSVVNGLIHIPSTSFGGQVEHLGVVLDSVADPFLFQRCNSAKEVHLPLLVLCQRVVDDEQTVVVDARHVFHHLVDRTWTELTATEIGNSARIAAETAATAGIEEVDHLNALVVVKIALVKVATAGAHRSNIRHVANVVVDLLQASILPVLDDLLRTTFRLAQKHAVDMVHHLLGMQHSRDASSQDGFTAFVVFICNGPAALHLRGKHHGEGHKIAFLVKINRLHILVGERNVDIFGQSGSKSHRTMRR